jgi:hypothetical protein
MGYNQNRKERNATRGALGVDFKSGAEEFNTPAVEEVKAEVTKVEETAPKKEKAPKTKAVKEEEVQEPVVDTIPTEATE